MDEEYTVTPRFKTEPSVAGKILVSVFYFIALYYLLFYLCRVFVSARLLIPYMIFSGVTGIVLTLPSPFNRKRKLYTSIILYLQKDRIVYRPALNVSVYKKMESLRMLIDEEERKK